ncbi:alpha/beta hydrolase [Anaeromyxobacter oryzae]|uniref:alpha/beta hydrolase n=1 Tax=Anaeromyxobacter oryzae TaxID=2918170 RepID=UPI0020C06C1B|nr:alpha/beta fold hydrolase [Anaeromyxobacter oryzae]
MNVAHVFRPPRAPTPRPPLLVLLHGIGADELDPRLAVASLRAPYEAEPMGHAWYAVDWRTTPPTGDFEQAEESRAALVALLPALAREHGTDPARTFLLGFSQGAILSLAVALTAPGLVRGIVLHSGRVLPGLAARVPPAAALAGLDALVLHGTQDDVIPVRRGREIRDLLGPLLGARLEYREHDAGHGVTAATLADVRRWLAARLG